MLDRLTSIRVFVEAVELGSLTAASEKIGISCAMVSRHLTQLEQWMGARLLHRSTRSIALTPAGNDALVHCRQMLKLAEDVTSAFSSKTADPSGLLRVASSISFGQTHLTNAATDYAGLHCGTAIDLVLADHTINLVEERIDLAIRITNELPPNLISRKLTTCRSVVCASPTYIARFGAPKQPQDLLLHNCLTHSYVGKDGWRFKCNGLPLTIPVRGSFASNDSVALLHASLAGVGIAYLPTYGTAPYIKSGALVHLLTEVQPVELGVYALYTSRKHLSAALRTWLDFLIERFHPETPYWDR